jgi:DNA-binding MarR family transcriptional regulator
MTATDQASITMETEANRFLRLRKAARSQLSKRMMSDSDWIVMLALRTLRPRGEGHNIKTVAARADFPRNTALRAIVKLESLGYVSLAPDTQDHRAMSVRLTSKGEKFLDGCLVRLNTGTVRL